MENYFHDIVQLVSRSESGISLFFIMKTAANSDDPIIKHVNLADEEDVNDNTSALLLKAFQEHVTYRLSMIDSEAVIPLSSADSREDAVYRYDLCDIPMHLQAMNACSGYVLLDDTDTFQFGKDNLDDVQAMVIIIGTADSMVALFKQSYPISLLKRDKFTLIPIPHTTRFKKLDSDLLKIDINFQFVLYKDCYYIFDLKKLESLTGFDGIIRKEAEKSIESIQKMDLLEDVQPLADEICDVTFARKLTRIYKDSKVIGKISNSDIIKFVQKHAYFKNHPIKHTASGDRLIVDTKASKNAFIRLLNDDLLYSALTQSEYESIAKNDITI